MISLPAPAGIVHSSRIEADDPKFLQLDNFLQLNRVKYKNMLDVCSMILGNPTSKVINRSIATLRIAV